MSTFKPMLATDADLSILRFPKLASAKLDGIRAIVIDKTVMSRNLKPIPNKFVQERFGKSEYEGLDGELIFGEPTAKDVYRRTTKAVMSQSSTDGVDVVFYAFDTIRSPTSPYGVRQPQAVRNGVVNLTQHPVYNMNELLHLEETLLDLGYEGLILRDPEGKYKYGRSTAIEQTLLKLKRFVDDEYEVIGVEERMHNGNEATKDELGRTKRSSAKAGKTGRGDLGALILRTSGGIVFNCGTGFSDDERASLWRNRQSLIGRMAKVKSFAIGVKDAPRFPVFLGWRHEIDR